MSLPFRKYSNDPNFHGYPLYYNVDGECVCNHCCNEAWESGEEYYQPIDHPARSNDVYNEEIAEAVNYDDKHLYCSNCGVRIETAYKEAEIEEENAFIYEFYHEHGRNPEEHEINEALGREVE